MMTSHEVQVEIRESILPIVRDLNERISALYRESASPYIGVQGLHGPESDVSVAYQLLDGAKNLMKSIAGHFEIPVADRDRELNTLRDTLRGFLKDADRILRDEDGEREVVGFVVSLTHKIEALGFSVQKSHESEQR